MAWLPQSSFMVRLFRSWWGCNVSQTSSSKSSFFSHPMRAASFSRSSTGVMLSSGLPQTSLGGAEKNSLRQITASFDLGRFQALYEHYHFIGLDHHLLSTFPFLDFVVNLGTAEIKPQTTWRYSIEERWAWGPGFGLFRGDVIIPQTIQSMNNQIDPTTTVTIISGLKGTILLGQFLSVGCFITYFHGDAKSLSSTSGQPGIRQLSTILALFQASNGTSFGGYRLSLHFWRFSKIPLTGRFIHGFCSTTSQKER